MKRWILLPMLALAALALAAASLADPGDGKGKRDKPVAGHKFTFQMTRTDNGSCSGQTGFENGQPWAVDTFRRTYKIEDMGDGTFKLTRRDRGTFTTIGGASPGACDTKGRHGTVVRSGVHGKFHGFLTGTVTGGTFNPNATCAADCGLGDVFVATFFGPNAQFTCNNGYAGCRFNFEYSAPAQGLKYHHWVDKETNQETEVFLGDIANR
jgi:hypothetical protein